MKIIGLENLNPEERMLVARQARELQGSRLWKLLQENIDTQVRQEFLMAPRANKDVVGAQYYETHQVLGRMTKILEGIGATAPA